MLEIVEIKNKINNGVTDPYIVRCQDQKLYVVKFPGNKETSKVLVSEFIASELCNYLDLPIFDYQLIKVRYDDYRDDMVEEIQPLEGTAFGTLYDADALTVPNEGSIIRSQNRNDAIKILIFDLLIGNYDRNPGNLMVNSKKIIMLDHSHIFLLGSLWDEKQLLFKKDLPFSVNDLNPKNYRMIMDSLSIGNNLKEELEIFIKKVKCLEKEQIKQIMNRIPRDWDINKNEKLVLIDFIYNRFQRVEEAIEILNLKVGDGNEK